MSTKRGHGGARKGSGRKEILNWLDQLHVGARAINHQRKLNERAAMRDFRDALERSGVNKARSEVRDHWRAWGFASDHLEEDVLFSLAEFKGDKLNPNPGRGVSLRWHDKGPSKKTRIVVARWATWYFGKQITERYVRKCIKTQRLFEEQVASET